MLNFTILISQFILPIIKWLVIIGTGMAGEYIRHLQQYHADNKECKEIIDQFYGKYDDDDDDIHRWESP